MSLQAKQRRRLLLLLAGMVAVAAIAVGIILVRSYYIKQRAFQGRTDGMAAMAQGDYATALVQLGKYLSRYPNDVDSLLPYAKARQLVEEPNGKHLGQAIGLYQRVLELRPGLPEAQRALLGLYFQVGYNTEAISLAEALLKQTPDDTNALRIKILSLMRMQRLADAEKYAGELTKIAPLDLDFHILEMQIMLNRGNQNLVEDYANRLALAHPNDVRFELLKSVAASLAGDPKTAVKLVQPLVARPRADAAYTRILVRQLDSLELFGDAFTVLQQAVKEKPDREAMQTWIRRLFETNRLPLLLEQTATLDPNAADSDVEVLGMRALALARLDRRPEALQLLAALNKRGGAKPSAAHWASALRALIQADTSDPVANIRLLQAALADNSGNPILLEELGDAYAAAGARDKATAIWREASRVAPAWGTPLVRLSQTLVAAGRPAAALAAAKAAQLRAPEDHDALICLITASAAALPEGPSAEATNVLAQIAEMQQRFPKDLGLLPLKAGVLVQTQQRDAALQVIRSALAADPAGPEQVLLAFARLSESFHLDQEEACLAACQKAHGLTPNLAFARARWLQSQKRGPEALALLEKARADHADDDIPWRSVWASYLDLAGDPRAKSEWVSLGDANPKNVKIQWEALTARSVQGDHDFVGRTIDRLVEALGQDSLALRLVRARWLLQGQSGEKDVTQASILLSDISRNAPEMVAPRLLLATSYMRLGNVSAAIDQLAQVSDMQPEQAGIALELARMLQARGDFARAKTYIDRAIHSKIATVEIMRRAASLLALQGEYSAALALLEKTYAGADQQPPDLVLAALYRQLNQPKKTDDICRRLLEKPDPATIGFCADFYASQGRPEDAQHALTLLDNLKLPPGTRELILADYATRYGSPEQALKQFQAATQAAPGEIVVWRQLVAFCLGTGKIDDALAAADQAAQKLTGPAAFDALRQNAALVKDAARIPGTRQLLMMLTGAGAGETPVLEALRAVVTAQQQKEPPAQTAAKLRKLADRNPRVLPLQTITLQFYMEAGQIDEAVAMATHAVQTFPAAVEPLRLATNVLGAAQQWDLALGTAKEWRRLGTGEALDADLAIAAAELHLGDANAASRQIQPYLERALLDPDKFSGVILLRAQSLLVSHQPAQVETLLGPLLAKSAQWRGLWVSLAVRGVDDPNRAQAWLEQAAPLMDKSPGEKTTLAVAWRAIGVRWAKPDLELKGRKLLEGIVQTPDAPVAALLAWGSLREASSDWGGAEAVYRRALKQDPKTAVALNNLAFVLTRSHGDLAEAQNLIGQALQLYPDQPAFLDTKATIQAALKDYTGAIAMLNEAIRLDPKNVVWHINLLAILLDARQTPAARKEAQLIATVLAATPNTPSELVQRYEALRAKVP